MKDPDNYFDVLTKRAVLFDQTERRAFLTTMAAQALPADCSVSDEAIAFIARFVEYPFVAVGSIPEKFRELPPEVLTAVIKKLKCIPVVASGGAISPRFLIVTDGVQASPVTGNYEKVLGDKLEDAHFFMEQDMKRPLASYVEGAKRIVYHPRWGSVHDRIVRFRAIAGGLPLALDGGVRERLLQAIDLCKNDLATLMVAEFPDLQGVIGRIYAQKEGCDGTVAWAIEEHYLPKFPGDRVPRTIEAAVLSLLDRMETLCGFLLEGAVLSGSGDPFGLRRVTGGLIDIIWRKELSLPVSGLVLAALKAMDPAQEGRAEDIRRFIFQRAENLLAAEGISAGVRRAVLAVETEDLLVLRRKADALKMFLAEEGAADMLIPFTRVANILSQARDKKISSGSFSPDLLREPAERALHHFLLAHGVEQAAHADAARYAEFLAALRTWKDPVDAFFTDILVMVPDEALRNNRLALLAEVNAVFFRFADFSFLSGEVMKS